MDKILSISLSSRDSRPRHLELFGNVFQLGVTRQCLSALNDWIQSVEKKCRRRTSTIHHDVIRAVDFCWQISLSTSDSFDWRFNLAGVWCKLLRAQSRYCQRHLNNHFPERHLTVLRERKAISLLSGRQHYGQFYGLLADGISKQHDSIWYDEKNLTSAWRLTENFSATE